MYKIGYFSLALSVYNASFYNSEKVMSLCSILSLALLKPLKSKIWFDWNIYVYRRIK